MAQTFFPITPVERNPAGTWDWLDVNVSGDIPAGSTGVILHILIAAGAGRVIGLRKNGSTDDRTAEKAFQESHSWAMIGVDGSRIFQAYVDSTIAVSIYVVGYTKAGVTFATNADQKVIGADNSWEELDCSVEAPSAVGLIFEIDEENGTTTLGLRKEGSTDDRKYIPDEKSCWGAIIGCDGSQICEAFANDESDMDLWLVGYVTDGATFITNATVLSLAGAGAYTNLAALPAGPPAAIMGFIEVTDDGEWQYGLREEGESGGHADIYGGAIFHPWAFVKCDASRIIEGKIQSTEVDFFLVGYATEATGWTGKIAGVTNPAEVGGVVNTGIESIKEVVSA